MEAKLFDSVLVHINLMITSADKLFIKQGLSEKFSWLKLHDKYRSVIIWASRPLEKISPEIRKGLSTKVPF